MIMLTRMNPHKGVGPRLQYTSTMTMPRMDPMQNSLYLPSLSLSLPRNGPAMMLAMPVPR